MADELTRSGPQAVEPWRPPEYCEYCGARLVPNVYFCLACATPYKSVESLLPAVLVAKPTDGLLIRKKAPHVWTVFWWFLGIVLVAAIVSHVAFRGERLDLQILLQDALLLIMTCVFATMHWRSLAVQLKRVGLFHYATGLGLAALAVLLAINYFYHGWLTQLTDTGDSFTTQIRSRLGDPGVIFFFCIFPAVIEEVAFRGLVQHWLQAAIPARRAIVLASALFVALHFSIVSAPYLFAIGMLLGWVKYKTGSLYPCMLIHFLHNFVALEYLFR